MFWVVKSLLLLASVEGVVDCENVLRVKVFLGLDHELNCKLGICLVEELLSLLAHSVMMRDTSSILHEDNSCSLFNLFKDFYCLFD